MCPIGGRNCWHREVEVAAADALRARFAYNRLRFVFAAALSGAVGARPVPFTAAIEEVVARVAPSLASAGVPWIVGGSGAAALQGVRIEPRDIDLATTSEGVRRMGDVLAEYLIEPVGRSRWGGGPPRWAARAFVGTFQEGVRVEWAEAEAPASGPSEWSVVTLEHPEWTQLKGTEVPVVPLEFALVKAHRLERRDRVDAIVERLREVGTNRELLDRLLAAAGGSDPANSRLTARLEGAPARAPPSRGTGS
jgi:hypothetical protein